VGGGGGKSLAAQKEVFADTKRQFPSPRGGRKVPAVRVYHAKGGLLTEDEQGEGKKGSSTQSFENYHVSFQKEETC